MKLKLKVLNNTDDVTKKQELGLDFSYNECDVGDVTFYSINAISKTYEGGKCWTEIFSNGRVFISPLQTEDIEKLIDDQMKFSQFTI